jgi:hypothetical protein
MVELIREQALIVEHSGLRPRSILSPRQDNPLILLQRQAGNRAVSRLVAGHLLQRCGPTPCECSPEERAAKAPARPDVSADLEPTLGAPALQRQVDDAALDNGSAPGDETSSSWMCDQIPIGRCSPCIPWLTSSTGFRKWCHAEICGNEGCVDFCKPHDCRPFESTSTSADTGDTSAESEEWTT